jgi:peptide/nickel transport system ATP-binding protein
LTALGILGLLADNLRACGSARLRGVPYDLVGADETDLAAVHGRAVAMVFQEPMTALNPTMRVGDQVAETMLVHQTQPSRRAARAAAVTLLRDVGLPDPDAAARAYPHQLSGGQRQRVVLAIALANDPALVVCDEPTTALDVTVQALVLDHITRGVDRRGAALLFISHDLAVVATVCSRVLVMYGGRVVEAGPVADVLTTPRHRYTEGLVGASMIESTDDRGRLRTIPGSVPAPGRFPAGCVFANRCPAADELCGSQPPWTATGADAGFACHHPAPPADRLGAADGR